MIKAKIIFMLMLVIIASSFTTDKSTIKLYKPLEAYTANVKKDFNSIPEERKLLLKKIALYTETKLKSGEESKLIFICTHNSRRSHMSQIWAQLAANYYGVKNVKTYSGGTEATAFNPRAVEAIKRAGFKIEKTTDDKNAIYKVKYNDTDEAFTAFSKKYNDASNPQNNFCAVMTCSQADKNCPSISGSSLRVAIPYEDPKAFDDKPEEAKMYDERCKQIATEMFYLFSLINNK